MKTQNFDHVVKYLATAPAKTANELRHFWARIYMMTAEENGHDLSYENALKQYDNNL